MSDHGADRRGDGASGSAVRRRQPPDVRRRMIVDAAISLLHERGIRGATLRNIAQAAGVSAGTVTYHFRSVHDIVDVAIAEDVTTYYERLEERIGEKHDPSAALEILTAGVFSDETYRHWKLWFDSLRLDGDAGDARTGQRERYVRWNEMLRGLVLNGMAEGTFTCADADEAVGMLVALVDGLSLQRVRGVPALTTARARDRFHQAATQLLGVDASSR